MTKKEFAKQYLYEKVENCFTWNQYAEHLNAKNEGFVYTTGEAVRKLIGVLPKDLNPISTNPVTPDQLDLKKVWYNGKTWCQSYAVNDSNLVQFKEDLLEELSEVGGFNFTTTEYEETDYMAELCLPDYHFGKIDGKSIHEQKNNFVRAVSKMASFATTYTIGKFVFPIGNDIFNTDNSHYTTTAGTPQKNNTHWHTMFHVAWTAVVQSIELLVKIAPVEVVVVQGNHDWQSSVHLGEVISAYFHNNPSVTVHNDAATPRKYISFGNTLLGYTHGDKEKPQDLPLIMATEVPALFAETKFREWHIGHLHKHSIQSYRGIKVEVLPSLVGTDEWHKQMGYDSLKEGIVKVYNKYSGPVADFKVRL